MRGEWGNSLKQTYVEGVGVGRTYKMNRDEQRSKITLHQSKLLFD